MDIQVRYFAAARELKGMARESLTIDTGTSVATVLAQISSDNHRFERLLSIAMPMVNQEYVSKDHVLQDGDELAIIPPVSGGQHNDLQDRFEIVAAPLELDEITSSVGTDTAGAVMSFIGTVRNNARGREVIELEYEAYEIAAVKMLHQIGAEIRARWSIERIAIVHRTGTLLPGEASVIIAISSAHREAAFASTRFAIERIKEIVPIWKHEHYADGSVWVGSESAYQSEARLEQASAI